MYPAHLLTEARELPDAPGVYTFHGEEDGLPLYIGKSVNIRTRVLSHLRAADEHRMLQQARRVSFVRTAGEIGALLLEARLIKAQQPLYNQRLRRSRQLCTWRLEAGRPKLVFAKELNFAREPDLYGLYPSRHAAQQHLRSLADEHGLCCSLLGLETCVHGRPCFRAQIGRCAGACCGAESADVHQARLKGALEALRLARWPYDDAIALVERDESLHDVHVVRDWCYLGTARTLDSARAMNTVDAAFDADSYKILCRPILEGKVERVPL